ncbi:hypothetical protein [Bdellovibrio sp. HCB288]|uniref:hypothetical protein n=1 Tax=Bdellovibrio sp. HCB288 TaxID=3394355 RepID=UPI0039B6ACA4
MFIRAPADSIHMKKFILFSIFVGFVATTLISCGSPPEKEKGTSSEPSESPDIADLGDDTALYVSLSTNWVGSEIQQTHGICSVSTMVQPESTIDCKLKAPEGQLYYSATTLTLGTKIPQLCPVVRFVPYMYRISNSDMYVPSGEKDPIKCATEASTTPKCWGGAATQVVSDFPKFNATFQVSAFTPSYGYVIASNTELLWAAGNRMIVNNMPVADRGSSQAGYIGGTFRDYSIICLDLWAHPIYTINLTIVDEDTLNLEEDALYDEITDWD